jgi:hypothetical protein
MAFGFSKASARGNVVVTATSTSACIAALSRISPSTFAGASHQELSTSRFGDCRTVRSGFSSVSARFQPSSSAYLTPSFFCRLDDDVVY